MSDLWEALGERLDYGRFVPRLIADLERFEYRTRRGERRIALKNPRGDRGAGTYIVLAEEDEQLLARMDGSSSVQQILVSHLMETGVFGIDRLGRLTSMLAANGFFGEERPNINQHLLRRRAMRRPIVRLRGLLRRAILWPITSWSNAHPAADLLYRLGGRVFFTRIGAGVLAGLIVAGLVLWARETTLGRHNLFRIGDSYAFGLVALIVLQVLGLTAHELGHALAVRHYGRNVRRLGLILYYLMPCAYVDSTDIVMAPRRAKIVVDAAGSVGGLALAAPAAIIATLAPPGSVEGSIAFKAASLLVFNNLLQLLPILELDGYHLLVDALDAPLLRQRAMTYARTRFISRLRNRAKLTGEEIGLAAFGLSAIGTSFVMLFFSLWIWQTRIRVLVRELWDSGLGGQLVTLAVAVIFLGPLLLSLAAMVLSWFGAGVEAVRRRQLAGRARPVLDRAEVLGRTIMFRDLKPAELRALAWHMEDVRVPPGTTIVREGEEGDRFFVIVEGEAEVVIGAEERMVRELGPGDGFGEIALLESRPRTATVRARTPVRLYALGRSHFHRWARERVGVLGRLRASLEERDRLAAVPVLASLSPGQLDRLAARLRQRRIPAGTVVFKQGEPPQAFYVILEGTAEVLVEGRRVRTLEPGPAGFFGEVALLTRGPRTATVRATSELLVYTLAKRDFDELVSASVDRGWFSEQLGVYARPALGTPARAS